MAVFCGLQCGESHSVSADNVCCCEAALVWQINQKLVAIVPACLTSPLTHLIISVEGLLRFYFISTVADVNVMHTKLAADRSYQ